MPGINRFGQGALEFDFTASHIVLEDDPTDNFDQVRGQLTELPGLSGAFNEYGLSPAPTVPGTITQELALVTTGSQSMDSYRDALNKIVSWGTQPLFKRLDDYPTSAERFCYAFVERIQDDRSGNHNNRFQRVRLTWRAPDPRWFALPSGWELYGDAQYGTAQWASPNQTLSASGVESEKTFTYNGNVPAEIHLVIKTSASQVVTSPVVIERLVNQYPVEKITITESLANSEQFDLNARRHKATRTVGALRSSIYDSRFVNTAAPWLTAVNGSNTYRITFGDSGDAATVEWWYYESYR